MSVLHSMPKPLYAKLSIEISERDASLTLSPGYEDGSGAWVYPYTEEEWEEAKNRARNKTFFRAHIVDSSANPPTMVCFESGYAASDSRESLLKELLRCCSVSITKHLMESFPDAPETIQMP